MRLTLPWAALLGTMLPAQAPLLVERIEAPMLYVSMAAPAAAPERDMARETGVPADLRAMLADPAFGALLEQSQAGSPGAAALQFLRGLIARATGELELALLGIAPAAPAGAGERSQRPLLVLRARLSEADATRLGGLLADGGLATPHRTVAGHPTWRMGDAAERPDFALEVAVVGADLIAANDASAMVELLGPARTEAAARTLARDARFRALRGQVDVPPGAMLVYGDWPRLARRLQTAFGGMPGFLLDYSGLGAANAIMAVVQAREQGIAASALVDFAHPMDRPAAGPGARENPGIDGWLGLLQERPARSLIAELPLGGLGGLVMAIDPAALGGAAAGGHAAAQPRSRGVGAGVGSFAGLSALLASGCRHRGLDFERQVLDRLGQHGHVQFLLLDGVDADPVATYAFGARSRKAAQDLFDDVARAARERGIGRVIGGDRRGEELLAFAEPGHGEATRFGAVDDLLVFASDAAAIPALRAERQRGSRNRGRREGEVLQALQELGIGRAPVAGIFSFELRPLLERSLAATGQIAGGQADLSRVPCRHSGFITLQDGRGDGPLLRLAVLSTN